MTGMVAYAGHAFDDDCHARQCPKLRREAVGFRTLSKRPIDLTQLFGLQSRSPAGSARLPQTRRALLSPSVKPTSYTLATDREHPSNRRLALRPRGEKTGRPLAPRFQPVKVSPWSEEFQHIQAYYARIPPVTLLCETQ